MRLKIVINIGELWATLDGSRVTGPEIDWRPAVIGFNLVTDEVTANIILLDQSETDGVDVVGTVKIALANVRAGNLTYPLSLQDKKVGHLIIGFQLIEDQPNLPIMRSMRSTMTVEATHSEHPHKFHY